MNCEDVQGLLGAYADDELSASDRLAVRGHVDGCETCARDVARIRALGRRVQALGRYPLPEGIERRIAALVDGAAQQPEASRWRSVRPSRIPVAVLLGSHAVAVLIGAIAVIAWLWLMPGKSPANGGREIVSAHVRGLLQNQFSSVESGNPHTVRPWFAGKTGFAPRVVDLAEAGFPLQGGRVDHVLGRPAAALVYVRRNHRITLFIAPHRAGEADPGDTGAGGSDGYHVVGWRDAEFTYWAVSDLNRAELHAFAALLGATVDRAGTRPPDP